MGDVHMFFTVLFIIVLTMSYTMIEIMNAKKKDNFRDFMLWEKRLDLTVFLLILYICLGILKIIF